MNDEEFPGGQGHGRDGGEKVSVITRLFSQLEESLDSQAPSGDAVEVTPVSPRDRAAALLRRAEKAVSRVDPSLAYAPDRQEAEALAQRYLEAARLEWEGAIGDRPACSLNWRWSGLPAPPRGDRKIPAGNRPGEERWRGTSPGGASDAGDGQAGNARPGIRLHPGRKRRRSLLPQDRLS